MNLHLCGLLLLRFSAPFLLRKYKLYMENIDERIRFQRRRVQNLRNQVHSQYQLLQVEKRLLQRLLMIQAITFMDQVIDQEAELPKLTLEDMEQICPAQEIQVEKLNETCSVCLNTFQEKATIRTLACGHTFHMDCIDRWMVGKEEPTCPTCRAPLLVLPQISEETFQEARNLEHTNNLRLAFYMIQSLMSVNT